MSSTELKHLWLNLWQRTYLAESYEPPHYHHGEQRPLTLACRDHKLEIHTSSPTSVVLPWFQWLQTTRHSHQYLQSVQHQHWLLISTQCHIRWSLQWYRTNWRWWSSINLYPLQYFLGLRPLHLLRDSRNTEVSSNVTCWLNTIFLFSGCHNCSLSYFFRHPKIQTSLLADSPCHVWH